jgi:membrane associated rhomboid family serine protease
MIRWADAISLSQRLPFRVMNQRFAFSRTQSGARSEPWFRLGSLDMGSTNVYLIGVVLGALIWVIDRPTLLRFFISGETLRSGEVWRLITWPFVQDYTGGRGFGVIFVLFNVYFFWMAGNRVEELLGRYRMAGFLAVLTIVPALTTVFLSGGEAGLTIVSMGVLLAFGVEYPGVQFLFGIPARIAAMVIIGLQAFIFIGERSSTPLIMLIVAVVASAIMLRSLGLGTDLPPWVPKVPLPGLAKSRAKTAKPRGSASRPSSSTGRTRRGGNLTVVPDTPATAESAGPRRTEPTPAEVDAVLDKISAHGISSLSADEKAILEAHSRRRRS